MYTQSLTVFANFRINDEERFTRMKDSFNSFSNISAQKWLINVRGIFKQDTILFLKEQLGDKLSPHTLESGKGWFYDSRQFINEINSDYVLVWNEDHINLVEPAIYDQILYEMAESVSEYLNYTWWFLGHTRKVYDTIIKTEYKTIETFILDKSNFNGLTLLGRTPFIISMPSIFSKNFFFKILKKNDPKLRRWPKETPFDFEKNEKDLHWLPIKMAISKMELFACIDDDNGIPGYSLQSRGLYPKREIRQKPMKEGRNLITIYLLSLIPHKLKYFLKRLTYHT
jgi:hypothetical protein